MKLSMWILANRLASFNPRINIRENSPMVLKSACLVYAKDCVRIYQDGADCVCTYDKDTIRLSDISLLEASVLVQSVFDSMADWLAVVSEAAMAEDFQTVADLCHPIFGNPTLLISSSCRVLGMSPENSLDEVDDEWRYLSTFGYSSAKAVSFMYQMQPPITLASKATRYSLLRPGAYRDGLTISISEKGSPLAYMTVLEMNRALNRGDMQVMELLADLLKPNIMRFMGRGSENAPTLSNLLSGQPLSEKELRQLELRMGWHSEHMFQVYLLSPGDREKKFTEQDIRVLLGALEHTFPDDLSGPSDGYLVLLADNTLLDSTVRLMRLRQLTRTNNLRLSYSLPFLGMRSVPLLWKQALQAFRLGTVLEPDEILHDFYDYAVDHLILSGNSRDSLMAACHPDVLALWSNPHDKKVLYNTLRVYLLNERSVTKTHSVLSIHKNTLLYRLSKLTDTLQYDIDDPYTREYMLLSFFILDRLPVYQEAHLQAENPLLGA